MELSRIERLLKACYKPTYMTICGGAPVVTLSREYTRDNKDPFGSATGGEPTVVKTVQLK